MRNAKVATCASVGVRRRLVAFAAWRVRCVPDRVFMVAVAMVTGLLCGVAAWLLKWLVRNISLLVTDGMHPDGVNWWLLALPVAGIVLTGIYERYIVGHIIFDGTAQLNREIAHSCFRLPVWQMYAPVLASSLTLGFGGSAGGEGPIACSGAAIGSNMGRWLRLTHQQMGVIVAAGSAAGIAGIFKAPVGGALFAVEVLSLPLTTVSVVMVFVATLTAALTAFVLSGFTLDIAYSMHAAFDWSLLPWMVLLGAFCGAYSAYYWKIVQSMRRRYHAMTNPWAKNVISGLVVGVLVFVFPTLYGEGYGIMTKVINGTDPHLLTAWSPWAGDGGSVGTVVLIALGVIAVKALACVSSNSGGGVAGDYAPTLMAGCVSGFFFATLLNMLFGLQLPVVWFAFCGMGAVMAGVIGAPLMAIFITVEMTATYTLLLPVALAGLTAYVVATPLKRMLTSSKM